MLLLIYNQKVNMNAKIEKTIGIIGTMCATGLFVIIDIVFITILILYVLGVIESPCIS